MSNGTSIDRQSRTRIMAYRSRYPRVGMLFRVQFKIAGSTRRPWDTRPSPFRKREARGYGSVFRLMDGINPVIVLSEDCSPPTVTFVSHHVCRCRDGCCWVIFTFYQIYIKAADYRSLTGMYRVRRRCRGACMS